ncbi:hypothetical protein WA158_003090 [Blastocystis sp. Blastoise]
MEDQIQKFEFNQSVVEQFVNQLEYATSPLFLTQPVNVIDFYAHLYQFPDAATSLITALFDRIAKLRKNQKLSSSRQLQYLFLNICYSLQFYLLICEYDTKHMESICKDLYIWIVASDDCPISLKTTLELCVSYIYGDQVNIHILNRYLRQLPNLSSQCYPSNHINNTRLFINGYQLSYYPSCIGYTLIYIFITPLARAQIFFPYVTMYEVDNESIYRPIQVLDHYAKTDMESLIPLLQFLFRFLIILYTQRCSVFFPSFYVPFQYFFSRYIYYPQPLGGMSKTFLEELNEEIYMPCGKYLDIFAQQVPLFFEPTNLQYSDQLLTLNVNYMTNNTLFVVTTHSDLYRHVQPTFLRSFSEFTLDSKLMKARMQDLIFCVLNQDISISRDKITNMSIYVLSSILRDLYRLYLLIKQMRPNGCECKAFRLSVYKELLPFHFSPKANCIDCMFNQDLLWDETTKIQVPPQFLGYNSEVICLREIEEEKLNNTFPYMTDSLGNRILLTHQEYLNIYDKVTTLLEQTNDLQPELPRLVLRLAPATLEAFSRVLAVYYVLSVEMGPEKFLPIYIYILPFFSNGLPIYLSRIDSTYYHFVYSSLVFMDLQLPIPSKYNIKTPYEDPDIIQLELYKSVIATYVRWGKCTKQLPVYICHCFTSVYPRGFDMKQSFYTHKPTISIPFVCFLEIGVIPTNAIHMINNHCSFYDIKLKDIKSLNNDDYCVTGYLQYTSCNSLGQKETLVSLPLDTYIRIAIISIPMILTAPVPNIPVDKESKFFYLHIIKQSSDIVSFIEKCANSKDFLEALSSQGDYIRVLDFSFHSTKPEPVNVVIDGQLYGQFTQVNVSRAVYKDNTTPFNFPIQTFD